MNQTCYHNAVAKTNHIPFFARFFLLDGIVSNSIDLTSGLKAWEQEVKYYVSICKLDIPLVFQYIRLVLQLELISLLEQHNFIISLVKLNTCKHTTLYIQSILSSIFPENYNIHVKCNKQSIIISSPDIIAKIYEGNKIVFLKCNETIEYIHAVLDWPFTLVEEKEEEWKEEWKKEWKKEDYSSSFSSFSSFSKPEAYIHLYQYIIENTHIDFSPNEFSNGFQFSQPQECGKIKANTLATEHNTLHSSIRSNSCDVITTPILFTSASISWHSFLRDLYDLCCIVPSKQRNPTSIQQMARMKWTEKYYLLFQELVLHQIKKNPKKQYIQFLNIKTNSNVILMGDLHGSMHTLLRNIVRLAAFQILSLSTLQFIHPNDCMIFLGDIVDRGIGVLETLTFILLLKQINPNQVYIISGNHETKDALDNPDGFYNHIQQRFHNEAFFHFIQNNMISLWNSLPYAIILRCQVVHEYSFIWLSHGAFPTKWTLTPFCTQEEMKTLNQFEITEMDNDKNNIVWGDFVQQNTIVETPHIMWKTSIRDNYKAEIAEFNKYGLTQFLNINHLDFMIRGHQDFYSNSFLFGELFKIAPNDFYISQLVPGLPFHILKDKPLTILGKDIISHISVQEETEHSIKNPMGTICANKDKFHFKENSYYEAYVVSQGCHVANEQGKSMHVYPCLTLSTATDIDRDLICDSFAILTFLQNEYKTNLQLLQDPNHILRFFY